VKLWNYIKKLIESDSQESSKRFIALFIVILITYTVIRFTNTKNYIDVLVILRNFVLALAGVGAAISMFKKK